MLTVMVVAVAPTLLPAQSQWDLPPGVAPPRVPSGAPMTPGRVELGRHVCYDTRPSGKDAQSCATCHIQALAFTDGRARGVGSTGVQWAEVVPGQAPSGR